MTLAAVQQAAQARSTAEQTYRSAVLDSVQVNGIRQTADAAGVTRQAVAQLVKRALSEDTAARERLAVLDARWQALVEWRAASYVLKDAASVTAGRNARAKRRAKRGLGPLPSVRSEAFALAETELLNLLQQGVHEQGLDLEVVREELEEAETLRTRLAPDGDGIPW